MFVNTHTAKFPLLINHIQLFIEFREGKDSWTKENWLTPEDQESDIVIRLDHKQDCIKVCRCSFDNLCINSEKPYHIKMASNVASAYLLDALIDLALYQCSLTRTDGSCLVCPQS